jgi:predicted lipase
MKDLKNNLKEIFKKNGIYELKDKFVEILTKKLDLIENNLAKQKDYHNLKSFFRMIEKDELADICEYLEYNQDDEKKKIIQKEMKKVIEEIKEID